MKVSARSPRSRTLTALAIGLCSVALASASVLAGSSVQISSDSVDAAQADLQKLQDEKGNEPLGTYLNDKIAILESHGQILDTFVMQIPNPGGVFEISYGQNQGRIDQIQRSLNADGTSTDKLVSTRVFMTARSGLLDPLDQRLSDPPSADFTSAINAIDLDHRASRLRPSTTGSTDPLVGLGLVGVAAAATSYDGFEDQPDLTLGFAVFRWGTGNHSMTLNSWGYWYGGLCGCASPGDNYDGLDAEWDPADVYMTNVSWMPNSPQMAGPFGWHGLHDISMSSGGNHAQLGADYQKPDKNSKYNDLYVYLAPKSTSSYGRGMNVYANYIHTWDWSFFTGVVFAASYGRFSISSAPSFTGHWEDNTYRALII